MTSDVVADALNNLYRAGKITVSGEALPFPRPTGTPQLLHGDGSPEGSTLAPQGSGYLRRDIASAGNAVYVKTTGVTESTGWQSLAGGAVQAGTSFPGAPSDGDEYVYVADAAGGVFWRFRYHATGGYWAFIGGPPLYSEVVTSEQATTSTTYTDLATAGPSIVLPFSGDFDLEIGALVRQVGASDANAYMSYQIGVTAAADADSIQFVSAYPSVFNDGASAARRRRKTGLAAVTLTAKYRADTSPGSNADFGNRYMAVCPVKH